MAEMDAERTCLGSGKFINPQKLVGSAFRVYKSSTKGEEFDRLYGVIMQSALGAYFFNCITEAQKMITSRLALAHGTPVQNLQRDIMASIEGRVNATEKEVLEGIWKSIGSARPVIDLARPKTDTFNGALLILTLDHTSGNIRALKVLEASLLIPKTSPVSRSRSRACRLFPKTASGTAKASSILRSSRRPCSKR